MSIRLSGWLIIYIGGAFVKVNVEQTWTWPSAGGESVVQLFSSPQLSPVLQSSQLVQCEIST